MKSIEECHCLCSINSFPDLSKFLEKSTVWTPAVPSFGTPSSTIVCTATPAVWGSAKKTTHTGSAAVGTITTWVNEEPRAYKILLFIWKLSFSPQYIFPIHALWNYLLYACFLNATGRFWEKGIPVYTCNILTFEAVYVLDGCKYKFYNRKLVVLTPMCTL